MVVDTSALMAILFQEAEGLIFREALLTTTAIYMSAGTRVEANIVALGKSEALDLELIQLIEILGIILVPVDEEQVQIARAGIRLYGKGRHRARLNLGDSFAYALAIQRDEPLLFKGNDFSFTDVRRVF